MRMKVLKFRPELLAKMLSSDSSLGASLSGDAKLIDIGLDEETHEVLAVFEITGNGQQEPEFAERKDGQCKSIAKIGACRFSEDIKNRFAPQHRNALSFGVESGVLLARPIQPLGYDWSEINDFVIGLGGRWIMDESTGHWEIPLL